MYIHIHIHMHIYRLYIAKKINVKGYWDFFFLKYYSKSL